MQLFSKAQKTPEEILEIEPKLPLTAEELQAAYLAAKARAKEGISLGNSLDRERNTGTEIDWAYRELAAKAHSCANDDEDDAISAVLFPMLTNEEAHLLSKPTGNVLQFKATNRSTNTQQSQLSEYVPELRDLYEKILPKPNATLGSSHEQFVAQPSRGIARTLTAPKTIKTVIGGEERSVVNTVAPAALTQEVQQKYQEILQKSELLGGEMLRLLRSAASIEKHEISIRTRISLNYLDALENDDFHLLPAPVYYRGFVASYLKYLGIYHKDLIHALVERYRTQRKNFYGTKN